MGIEKYLEVLLFSMLTGGSAAVTGITLGNHCSQRTAIVQNYLSQQSELTGAVLEAADNYAGQLVGYSWPVYVMGLSTGLLGGMTLFSASKKEK